MSDSTRHYTGEQGRVYHQQKRGIPDEAFDWVARLRAEKLSPYISSEDSVLEFGVGSGWNLAHLTCKRKIGTDVYTEATDRLRSQGIELLSSTQVISHSTIDVVLCHHALEHVLNPPEVLRGFLPLLKTSGKLLLFVPFEKERRYRKFQRGEPNHHLYSWNVQTLGNLVEEVGYRVSEAGVGEFGYDRFAAVWANKFQMGETGFRFIRRAAHTFRPARELRLIATKV